MFPTSGYFRAVVCPFYVSGLCERPYCHFRHTKQDCEKSKDDLPSYSTASVRSTSPIGGSLSSPSSFSGSGTEEAYTTAGHDPKETFTNSAPKSANELLLANTTASFAIPSFTDSTNKYQLPTAVEARDTESYKTVDSQEDWSERKKSAKLQVEADSLPVYYPTPKTPSLPTSLTASVNSSIPEYQPTPKRELKKRKVSYQCATDLEYDPENNYSCGGLGGPNKSEEYLSEIKKPRSIDEKVQTSSRKYSRLSCESLNGENYEMRLSTGSSGDVDMLNCGGGGDDDNDDDGPVDAKFSDEEIESEPELKSEPVKDGDDNDSLGSLADICDDDISSDDNLVEVPDVPVANTAGRKILSASHSKGTKKKSVLLKRDVRKDSNRPQSVTPDSTKSKTKSRDSPRIKSTDNVPSKEKLKSSHDGVNSKSSTHSTSDRVSFKSGHKVEFKTIPKSGSSKSEKSHLLNHITSPSMSSKHHKYTSSSRKAAGDASIERKNSSEESSLTEKHHSNKLTKDKGHMSSKGSRSTGGKHGTSLSKSLTHVSSKDRQYHRNEQTSSKKVKKQSSSDSTRNSKTESSESSCARDSKTGHAQEVKLRQDSRENRPIKSGHDGKGHSSSSSKSSSTQVLSKNRPDSSSSASADMAKAKKLGSGSGVQDTSVDLASIKSSLFGDDSDDLEENPAENTKDVKVTSPDNVDTESNMDYSAFIHDSDLEEDDTFDECLRIFRESSAQIPHAQPKEKKLVKDMKTTNLEPVPSVHVGKKRIAHESTIKGKKPVLLQKYQARHHPSPAEVMHNRIMEMQRRALERAARLAVQEQEVSSTSGLAKPAETTPDILNREKKRIAHTPKPATPVTASSCASSKSPSKKAEDPVPVSTASKTEKRMAHTPNVTNLKRPMIPASFGSKVPSNIRQRYLNLIIDECLKFCSSEEEAYSKGLEEETGVYERSNNKNIYLRVAVNTISRLRAEAKEVLPKNSSVQQRRASLTQSHAATLGGSRAAKTSFSIKKPSSSVKAADTSMSVQDFHCKLQKYVLTEEQLHENGFPRLSVERRGEAVFFGTRYHQEDVLLKGNERNCSRCGKRFIINSDGTIATQEECVYHWTRAYMRKRNGFLQLIYNCCESDAGSKGCQVASSHVHDRNKYQNLTGYVTTLPSTSTDKNCGVYALDCEMVYTLDGLELARVTVINMDGKAVFESLVQPSTSIIDYNTRFSGLTAGDLEKVTTTLRDIQAILLSMFSDKTILIGHSLESDFTALKLIHSSVVDTSVVFPHKKGPPYKRALKNLMVEIFRKLIQTDDGGHDSKEDAQACMDLMKWRIREDTKKEQRYIT